MEAGIKPRGGDREVVILNAGVFHHVVADGLIPALRRDLGIEARHESGPSVDLARALVDGSKAADIFLSADAQVSALVLEAGPRPRAGWHVTVARNSVVLAYSPRSRYRDEFARAASGEIAWFDVLERPGVRLVRGDPNRDPLAYFTLLVVDLAELHHGVPGLKRRILGDDLNPAQLAGLSFAGLESGQVDAIFLYRSIALDRQMPFVPLPDAINLGDSTQTKGYQRVSYVTTQGERFVGGPIRQSATVLASAVNPEGATELIAFLLGLDGQRLLQDYNFMPGDALSGGDLAAMPARLKPLVHPTSST